MSSMTEIKCCRCIARNSKSSSKNFFFKFEISQFWHYNNFKKCAEIQILCARVKDLKYHKIIKIIIKFSGFVRPAEKKTRPEPNFSRSSKKSRS